jgi:hypothetical protein
VNERHLRVTGLRAALILAGLVLSCPRNGWAQLTQAEEERLQILTEPDSLKKKLEKDRTRAPFEFFRSQVAPFDVLPYVKPNHWSRFTLEMRANEEDFEGYLQSDAVKLLGMPVEVAYRTEARLLKEQRRGLAQHVMLTMVPKEWTLDLVRPGALRPDATWQASLTMLEPHQMLVLVLSKESTNHYAAWNRMAAFIPTGAERDSRTDIDKLRYYRLVLPMEPDKPTLSSHPLTWSTISHVVWDGMAPDVLSVSQQQALLDWVQWGGQLIFTGGAGQAYALYRESFLGPYLPAEASGQTAALGPDDLKALSQSYPPPTAPILASAETADQSGPALNEFFQRFGRTYQPPAPLQPPRDKPIYMSVLKAVSGATTVPLGEASPHLLAVERRVGRGRITMLTLNPTEPILSAWPGIDTLVRRVVLRRPEEDLMTIAGFNGYSYEAPRRSRLTARDLTWYRIAGRDARVEDDAAGHRPEPTPIKERAPNAADGTSDPDAELPPAQGVADWRDTMRFATLSRDLLEEASGITIPSSDFVLKVILAYLIAVVPLNWLVCRFVLNRREWAWVVVPLVALGFAIAVQRVAAYDMGFDSASDEIDVLELQGDYPRAHLSRFASLYTTGRGSYTISYPNNNTALALPLNNGRSIRGEDVTTSAWQSSPVPALLGLAVQPRSLSLFRAEEMATLSGAIQIEGEGATRKLVNRTELDLRDATLVDFGAPGRRTEQYLGTIAAGSSADIDPARAVSPPGRVDFDPGPDPNEYLLALRTTWEPREENIGEIRLVAWVSRTMPGQVIEPPVDRQRGFTAVIVHLRSGQAPHPGGQRYNLLARGPESMPTAEQLRQLEQQNQAAMGGRAGPMMQGRRAPMQKKAMMPAPGRGAKTARP